MRVLRDYLGCMLASLVGVFLSENRPEGCGDFKLSMLTDMREDVSQEVNSATLPFRHGQYRGDRGLEALVGIADDQVDSVQTSGC